MAELRPWVSSLLSVGHFKILRELKIVNCTNDERPSIYYFGEVPSDKWDQTVWADVDQAFSQPVTMADDTCEYAPTQIITDLFKAHNFDGPAYRSSPGKGHNLVLFDLDAADLIRCQLYEVKNINFEFEEAGNPYSVTKYLKDADVHE